MLRKLILLAVVLTALLPSTVLAIGDPDPTYRINTAYLFRNVLIEGDALYLAAFDLNYTDAGIPDEPATDTWQGIIIDDAGGGIITIFPSSAPFYADQSPFNGYNEGVFGIYTEVEYEIASTLKICLNPVSSTGDRRCISDISIYVSAPSSTLNGKLVQIFENLEKEWILEDDSIDLIEPLADVTKVFTLEGEDYAINMIPQLRAILPEIFSTSIVSPNLVEESFDTAASDANADFFEGSELDASDPNSSLSAIATYTKIPTSIIGLVIVLGVAAAIAGAIISATGRSEVGMLAAIMCLTAGTYVGLVPFALAGIFAMLGALALGYIFFYKSSTS